MTATTNDHSIQAISYCAKNPSQKLPPEQARVVRNQQRTKNSIHLNTEEEDEDDEVFEKVMFCEISHFSFFLQKIVKPTNFHFPGDTQTNIQLHVANNANFICSNVEEFDQNDKKFDCITFCFPITCSGGDIFLCSYWTRA